MNRWSQFFLHTLREDPGDAEVVSHRLMVRAGMIEKLAAGIYTYLPAGWRSLNKLMAIVRREMDRSGAIELQMPAIQPAELWMESGRWQKYGKELLRIEDRHGRSFCFGPTHEEVMTDLVRRKVRSYRQLPFNLYQIQTKFRDEIRPRFGLMRGREFLMKDAYSFAASEADLDATYRAMHEAYCRIFSACGLEYTVVEADTGAIGGSSSHEFMVTASTGESAVLTCPSCRYGANQEKAERGPWGERPEGQVGEARLVDTPGKRRVEEVAEFLGIGPDQLVKTLLFRTEKGYLAGLVRGDRELNSVALAHAAGVDHLELASEERVASDLGLPVGYVGPVGLPEEVRVLADRSVASLSGFACGANQPDRHWTGLVWGRDLKLPELVDAVLVVGGDPCPQCGQPLELSRGIEVGHIFKLGTKYSDAMRCCFTDANGVERPMIMGCYGLGIGRTLAAAIEQRHDEWGICWPLPLAPWSVLVAVLTPHDPKAREIAESLAAQVEARGWDVLIDDREERPGVKFYDADLVGFPIRVFVGGRSLSQGQVELSLRKDRQKLPVPVGEAAAKLLELLAAQA